MLMQLQCALFALSNLILHSSALKTDLPWTDLHVRHHGAADRGVRIPQHEATNIIVRSSSLALPTCLTLWQDCTVDSQNCCDGFKCIQVDAAGTGRCLDLVDTCASQCNEEPPTSGIFPDVYSNKIRVNQVGYLRLATKIGVIVDDSTTPMEWQIQDTVVGSVVMNGTTSVYGDDGASGDHVHQADFSSLADLGAYKLVVDGVGSSLEFHIAATLYPNLPHDAMNYFYFHRMGVKIEGEHLVDDRYARAALHANDTAVPPYSGWCESCDDFDLLGSWADAGDFGIYPVNHAISAWTLLNLHEMFPAAFGDGELNLPESGNSFPDVLDEVDYGSRFVRGMLPSDGGLASHKAHNHAWSPFTITVEGENAAGDARSAMGSSTPATYAVARVNAQLARVWHSEGGDPAHVATLWSAAEDAWNRADGTDEAYNPAEASPGPSVGGGDYPDSNTNDDRYAAACEMYLTAYALEDSDVEVYRTSVTTAFEYFTAMRQWDWATVTGAGTLSLYAVDNDLSSSDKMWIGRNIVSFANQIKMAIDSEGYPSNLKYGSEFGQYPWGSNSFIMNRMIALAYAYEITGDLSYQKYLLRSMDYIMGTNAMDISYVTGYGEKSETDTHDRWAWTIGQDAFWPKGWLSGGPNNELINDYETPGGVAAAKSYAGRGTAPYAWGSKENTVNWNAPLAWAAWYIENKVVPNLGGCGDQCPPVADSTSVKLQMDTFINLSLSASDEGGNVVAWEIIDSPVFGTLSGDAPDLTYTPNTGALGTDTFTFRVTDNTGEVSNIASVTLLVQDCDLIDIFQVPSEFPVFFGVYNYVHISEDGPSLDNINKPAHSVHWLNPGFYQFSLLWKTEPYFENLLACMSNQTLAGPNASFTLSGCGIDGLDGDYWITRQDGNEIWVEKNNGWALVFTNDDSYTPEFCRSSETTGSGVQEWPATSNSMGSNTTEPTDQHTNSTTNAPSDQLATISTETLVSISPTNAPSDQLATISTETLVSISPTNAPSDQLASVSTETQVSISPTNVPSDQPKTLPTIEVAQVPIESPTYVPSAQPKTLPTNAPSTSSLTGSGTVAEFESTTHNITAAPSNQPASKVTNVTTSAPQVTFAPTPNSSISGTVCCAGVDSGYQACKSDASCSVSPTNCSSCNGIMMRVPLQRSGCCSFGGQDCGNTDPTANPGCQYMQSDCEGSCAGSWRPF